MNNYSPKYGNLLILPLFQTYMTLFPLWNTNRLLKSYVNFL